MSRQASNIIKAANLGAAAGMPGLQPMTPSKAATVHQESDTARIELHRDGDLIEAIEITCSCGRTTFIECVYEDQEPAP